MTSPALPGRLWLVPTPLDFGVEPQASITDALPLGTLQMAAQLEFWVAENAKSLRAFLKRVDAVVPLKQAIQQVQIRELPRMAHKKGDHAAAAGAFDARDWLQPALRGADVGLASEAGMPGVADPGASVVVAAHQLNLRVHPLPGAVSLMLALAGSGLNGQRFAFRGYAPVADTERRQFLVALEATALESGECQLLIETPYRNPTLFNALIHTLQPQTRLAVASGLGTSKQSVLSETVRQWRQHRESPDLTLPTVFLFGR